jgi:hypothetical protein
VSSIIGTRWLGGRARFRRPRAELGAVVSDLGDGGRLAPCFTPVGTDASAESSSRPSSILTSPSPRLTGPEPGVNGPQPDRGHSQKADIPGQSPSALRAPLQDRYSARRGTYRVSYRIDDNHRSVTVVGVFSRRDVYRLDSSPRLEHLPVCWSAAPPGNK